MKSQIIGCVLTVLATGILSAAEARLNVLLIVSDDLTACLGSYGNSVCKTPNLDKLAREGVVFEKAYCQYPVCGPSRASLMSGLYPGTTKMLGNLKQEGSYKVSNPALADHPSIGGLLRQQGYFSARISKIFHMGIPGDIEAGRGGADDPDSWDWTCNVMAPETFSPGKLTVLTPERAAWGSNFATLEVPDQQSATQADVLSAQQAVAFLQNRAGPRHEDPKYMRPKSGAPFFLALGFVRPHVPLVAPARLYRQYPADTIKLPAVPENDLGDVPLPAAAMNNATRYKMTAAAQRQAIAGYYASVSFMDEQVGRVLDELDRLNLRQNTVIAFVSDHGYSLGEHDCWQKLSLFEESTRVPMIISAPGFATSAGKKVQGIVELVDLYPTLIDLAGLREHIPARVQGTSLRPWLENPDHKDWVKDCAYTMTNDKGESIRTARWRYNTWGKAGEELYDHDTDPEEFINLANSPEHSSVLTELRGKLQTARQRAGQP